MDNTDRVVAAARAAIARCKSQSRENLTPDDLLIGLLQQVSRFGIAQVGPWAIDVDALAGALPPGGSSGLRPTYTDQTVRIFERAAAVARRDGARDIDVVHLLVAYAYEECSLFACLCETEGITPFGWRTALATWEAPVLSSSVLGATDPAPAGRARRSGLYTTEEAAEYLRVHTQTVRNYIRTGKLPAYRVAGERKIRIHPDDLQALLEPVSMEEEELDLPV